MGIITTLVLGCGIVLIIAPTQLPKYSRIFGRWTGRSVKLLFETKQNLSENQNIEVLKLKREFEEGFQELSSIRGELRQGLSLRNTVVGLSSTSAAALSHPKQDNSTQQFVQRNEQVQHGDHQTQDSPSVQHSGHQTQNVAPVQHNGHRVQTRQHFGHAFSTLNSHDSHHASTSSSAVAQRNGQQNPLFAHVKLHNYEDDNYEDIPMMRGKPDPQNAPFSTLHFGHVYHRELTDDTTIPTERMGSGADFIGISLLEENYARFMQGQEQSKVEQGNVKQ